MEIKGTVHCLFEQSGTFKNEFKKLGINAIDYDIQNQFKETDYVIDLFTEAGSRCKIALGFAVELPDNYEIVIRGRSGLSSTEYVDVIEGTIDSDYRGEILAIIANNGKGDFSIKNGDRICQIAVREVPEINFIETDSLSSTERGNKGFGSTGA